MKRLNNVRNLLDRKRLYPLNEAIRLVKESAIAKFDETIEIAVNLNLDPKHADQQLRSSVILPHGNGKILRIAVFARGDKADLAKQAGADIVGAEDLMEKILSGKINFDRCIALPEMMGIVGRLGKVLGPRNLMPNPKLGTVTSDIVTAIKAAKSGDVQYRVEKSGIVHAGIGRASFSDEAIYDNVCAFMKSVHAARPSGAKGYYVKKVSISSTMGIGVAIDMALVTK